MKIYHLEAIGERRYLFSWENKARMIYLFFSMVTSGRISSEMELKAVYSGIPIVASSTTCMDLAVEIAEEAGLTLIKPEFRS